MKSTQTTTLFAVLSLLFAMLFWGQSTTQDIVVLYPVQTADSVSFDQAKIFLIATAKDSAPTLTFSKPWAVTRYFDFRVPDLRDNFAKEFLRLFDQSASIEKVRWIFKTDNVLSQPESLAYPFAANMTIRSLWATKEFSSFLKYVQSSKSVSMIVTAQGWKDSVYTTTYDDPTGDGRALFKIQANLVSGRNVLYFNKFADRTKAFEYTTMLGIEQKSIDSREHRFHFSTLEASCAMCHEGLPSSDSGHTMKADCNVCHKSIASAQFVHSPVEMKECGSCHEWSAEKQLMPGPAVPDKCFECHTEKKAEMDSAKVQHPVASDCATCHSAHSTGEPHLLKARVYDLCTSCHPNQKLNHPVGRHPMQYVKYGKEEQEISCVSCHNPHGSQNEHLLAAEGGSMAICAKCHQ